MKLFACKEADLDCPFEVREETVEGVTKKAMEHITSVHSELKLHILDVLPEEKRNQVMREWVRDI